MTPSTPTIFCAASRNGAAIIEEPDSENSLFSEPMKMRTPSPPSARPRRSITSVWVSRSANSRRMRSRSSTALQILEQVGLAAHDELAGVRPGRRLVARPASTSRAVSASSSRSISARRASTSRLISASVRPRMRALRKLRGLGQRRRRGRPAGRSSEPVLDRAVLATRARRARGPARGGRTRHASAADSTSW